MIYPEDTRRKDHYVTTQQRDPIESLEWTKILSTCWSPLLVAAVQELSAEILALKIKVGS